ncbi:uncharacterized protein C8R40DRAFT_670242 [Lentinula edodes]|uniref:uncharacterized protein n=1 Tax=Lentinula edodes TaxID=5353 RepID=UPI001E8D4DCA|nr:uncharacterized protein C8R40DRAFT_670242 [Lentinula edodes]KAH7869986.1 hypothetical protein C8R40DRAFT_670242 [Lentinula edodes]
MSSNPRSPSYGHDGRPGQGRSQSNNSDLPISRRSAILHEENVLSRRTLDPHRNPTVGFGSHDFHIDGTIRPGAFSVVAGAQIIRTSSSSASPYVHSPFHSHQTPSLAAHQTHLTHGVSHPAPSVLSGFRRRDSRDSLAHPPGVIFGEGSFSAVSGRSEITTRKGDVRIEGLSAAHVLRDQSQIPPANSRTDRGTPFHTPGSHSAIAGHQFGPAPNVLMGARDFRSQGGDFRSGSFSAVAGNRIVILKEQRPFAQDDYMDYGERRRNNRSSHSPESYGARRR